MTARHRGYVTFSPSVAGAPLAALTAQLLAATMEKAGPTARTEAGVSREPLVRLSL